MQQTNNFKLQEQFIVHRFILSIINPIVCTVTCCKRIHHLMLYNMLIKHAVSVYELEGGRTTNSGLEFLY